MAKANKSKIKSKRRPETETAEIEIINLENDDIELENKKAEDSRATVNMSSLNKRKSGSDNIIDIEIIKLDNDDTEVGKTHKEDPMATFNTLAQLAVNKRQSGLQVAEIEVVDLVNDEDDTEVQIVNQKHSVEKTNHEGLVERNNQEDSVQIINQEDSLQIINEEDAVDQINHEVNQEDSVLATVNTSTVNKLKSKLEVVEIEIIGLDIDEDGTEVQIVNQKDEVEIINEEDVVDKINHEVNQEDSLLVTVNTSTVNKLKSGLEVVEIEIIGLDNHEATDVEIINPEDSVEIINPEDSVEIINPEDSVEIINPEDSVQVSDNPLALNKRKAKSELEIIEIEILNDGVVEMETNNEEDLLSSENDILPQVDDCDLDLFPDMSFEFKGFSDDDSTVNGENGEVRDDPTNTETVNTTGPNPRGATGVNSTSRQKLSVSRSVITKRVPTSNPRKRARASSQWNAISRSSL